MVPLTQPMATVWGLQELTQKNADTLATAIAVSNTLLSSLIQGFYVFCQYPVNCNRLVF